MLWFCFCQYFRMKFTGDALPLCEVVLGNFWAMLLLFVWVKLHQAPSIFMWNTLNFNKLTVASVRFMCFHFNVSNNNERQMKYFTNTFHALLFFVFHLSTTFFSQISSWFHFSVWFSWRLPFWCCENLEGNLLSLSYR